MFLHSPELDPAGIEGRFASGRAAFFVGSPGGFLGFAEFFCGRFLRRFQTTRMEAGMGSGRVRARSSVGLGRSAAAGRARVRWSEVLGERWSVALGERFLAL